MDPNNQNNPYQEQPSRPPMVVVPGQWIPQQQPVQPGQPSGQANPYAQQPPSPYETPSPQPPQPPQPIEPNPYEPQVTTPPIQLVQSAPQSLNPSPQPLATPLPPAGTLPFIPPAVPNPSYSGKPGLDPRRMLLFVALLIPLLLIGLWFVPSIRLALLNALGAGATLQISTVTVVGQADNKQQPLNNVTLTVNGVQVKTGDKSKVTVGSIPYGSVVIKASKAGYNDSTFRTTLNFDPLFGITGGGAKVNPTITLVANGPPVSFKVVDWLSDKPITSGQFTIGDVTVTPDAQGMVRARLAEANQKTVTIQSKFGGSYIDRKFDFTIPAKSVTNQSPPTVNFVPFGKHYYFGGKGSPYTLYSSNLDGSDAKEVVQATGKETPDVNFVVSPDGEHGILASSRDGARDAEQELLQRVYLVDLKTKKLTKVDEANNITFADWSGTTFAYVLTNNKPGSKREQTLRTVDAANGRVYNFETAAGITSLVIAHQKLVYLRQDTEAPQSQQSPQLKVATVQGNDIKTLGSKVDAGSVVQLSYGNLAFKSADQAWQEYGMESAEQKTTTQPDTSLNTKTKYLAVPSQDNSRRLFLKGSGQAYALFMQDVTNSQNKELIPASNFTRSIRWFNSSVVVFSLIVDQKPQTYAISAEANTPKKIGPGATPVTGQTAVTTGVSGTITPR